MTDAITQARANVHLDLTMSTDADIDAFIASVRAETLRQVANEIGLASSVPMRSATPGDMAVLLFANRLISRLDALAQPEGK